MKSRFLTVLAAAMFVGCFVTGSASAAVVFQTSFGGSGTTPGKFNSPNGVAVNNTTGDVYVADRNQNRIQQFDAAGNFLRTWGREVNEQTKGDICPVNPGDTCLVGQFSVNSGGFFNPQGIAVDNSPGSPGYVYVQDAGANRVQKFTANGQFLLMWGKGVNTTTGGDICPVNPGDVCGAGGTSGTKTPFVPSADGVFAGWSGFTGPSIGVDGAGYVYVGDPLAVPFPRVQKFDSSGQYVGKIAAANDADPKTALGTGINQLRRLTVDSAGNAYVLEEEDSAIKRFDATDFSPAGQPAGYDYFYDYVKLKPFVGTIQGLGIDPSNGFLFVVDRVQVDCNEAIAVNTTRILEFHPHGQAVDCTAPITPAFGNGGGVAVSPSHKMYAADATNRLIKVFGTPSAEAPTVSGQTVSSITATGGMIEAKVAGRLADTTFHVEYGLGPCSSNSCQSTAESAGIGAALSAVSVKQQLNGLDPDTNYFYRVVATNSVDSVAGSDQSFTTFSEPVFDASCPNNLARQQTSAALLLDCRAYELVSAEDQGGYNVEADLVPGQTPQAGYPDAPGRAVYAVHDGGIPGTANPTNRGPDPYLAVRDEDNQRWNTEYVGVPANAPSSEPFSSPLVGADLGLSTFAFGGPDICDPCFDDGSAGLPLRTADGALVQGMAGSIPVTDPTPAGEVQKPLSGDGVHFIFGSMQEFEPAANSSGTDATIYDRNLETGTTQVVSTLPNGDPIEAGEDVAELDISSDGSRVLIGELVGTDGEGNRLWHLYMHVGDSAESIDLTSGSSSGVQYAGMSADGTEVYFTTPDPLSTVGNQDSDTSADLFSADVGSSSAVLRRVSTGTGGTGNTDSCNPAADSYNPIDWNVVPGGPTNCSVVALGGRGGVAPQSGFVYFLSPEKLDGNGVVGAPNLFLARPGDEPEFVATLESSASTPLPPPAFVYQSSFGSFSSTVSGAAVDNSNGDIYVFDLNGAALENKAYVQKLDASGTPISAWGTGGKITGVTAVADGSLLGGKPGGFPAAITVDNNPLSSNFRDVYIPDQAGNVKRYDGQTGVLQDTITVGGTFTPPMAIAINPVNKKVYVAETSIFGGTAIVRVYDSNGDPVSDPGEPATIAISTPAYGIAVSQTGRLYVASAASTNSYKLDGTDAKTLDANASLGVAVDIADDHVFVDEGSQIVEFNSAGVQVGSPIGGAHFSKSRSLGIASGRLVVSDPGAGKVAFYKKFDAPPNRAYDHPLVIDSVREAETRHTADFQSSSNGDTSAFPSVLPLAGVDGSGHYEIFRYDAATDDVACLSCTPTGLPPTTDSNLASNGSSIADDGRVFFNTGERLVQRDANSKRDVYQWSDGTVELVSTGTSSFDSSLLSVTRDGVDAFFFTRDTLVSGDRNGELVKLYDARADGGFFRVPGAPPCVASDECHGPGSQSPGPSAVGTLAGSGGNQPKTCPKGKRMRKGRCVRKHPRHSKRNPKRTHADHGGNR